MGTGLLLGAEQGRGERELCGQGPWGRAGRGWTGRNTEGRGGRRESARRKERERNRRGWREPHRAGTRADKRSRASAETGGEQHPFGSHLEGGEGQERRQKTEAESRGKEAPPWRNMRMASSRREPRSCARSRGTSSCRSPASQWSPEGRSSSLLLLTRREDAERGSPAQPSATGRKQWTKCSFDFLMVSMRASCQGERDRPQWILMAWAVPRTASLLLTGRQVSRCWPRHAKPGQLHPHEARGPLGQQH